MSLDKRTRRAHRTPGQVYEPLRFRPVHDQADGQPGNAVRIAAGSLADPVELTAVGNRVMLRA
jgi:hypothetical protein